jgi:hypothetical protein
MVAVGDLDVLRMRLARRFPAAEPAADVAELAARVGHPLRVAIVRPDGIGDWVMSLGLIDGLLASPSVVEVTIVAPGGYRSLLGHRGGVGFEPFAAPTIIAPSRPRGGAGKVIALSRVGQRRAIRAGEAQRGRFDLAVLPRWDTDAGFNARAWALGAGAALAGHDPALVPGAGPREREESTLLTIRAADDRVAAHDTSHSASLAAALGIPVFGPEGVGLRQFGAARVAPGPRPLVVMHAGSNEPRRRWPAERWHEVAAALLAEGAEVVIVGGPEDVETNDRIMAGLHGPISSTAGKLPLGELPALLARASAFVGNDSGPAHLACSVGTPVVTVVHPAPGSDPAHRSSLERFGPWGVPHRIVQPAHSVPPCSGTCGASEAHCIAAIPSGDVIAAVRELLALSA